MCLQEVMGSEQLLILQMYAKFVGRLENRLFSLEEVQAWTFKDLMCCKFQVLPIHYGNLYIFL